MNYEQSRIFNKDAKNMENRKMSPEYWSCNEDDENCLARDPLEAAQEEQAGIRDVITVYRFIASLPPKPSDLLRYQCISDSMIDRVHYEYGENAGNSWNYDIDAFTDHMNTCINKWFQDNDCMPTFFKLLEITPFKFIVTKVGPYGYIEEIEKVES